MKKIIYTGNNASPADLLIGPSKFARFNGFGPAPGMVDMGMIAGVGLRGIEGGSSVLNHSFNHGSIMYSLRHFLEPEIAKQHADWTQDQVKTEARKQMSISLWESHAYYSRERRREPVIEKKWEVVETAEGTLELSTTWGNQRYTLRELWDHTKQAANDKSNPDTYNPAAYNEAERDAQLAMQDALISGRATTAVTMLSDVDSYRYAQVWEKSDDETFSVKVIDLGLSAGRDFSQEEAKEIINGIAGFYDSQFTTETEHPHFMTRGESVDPKDVQNIVQAQTLALSLGMTMAYATARTMKDTVSTVSDVTRYIQSRMEKRKMIDGKKELFEKPRLPFFLQLLGQKDTPHTQTSPSDSKNKDAHRQTKSQGEEQQSFIELKSLIAIHKQIKEMKKSNQSSLKKKEKHTRKMFRREKSLLKKRRRLLEIKFPSLLTEFKKRKHTSKRKDKDRILFMHKDAFVKNRVIKDAADKSKKENAKMEKSIHLLTLAKRLIRRKEHGVRAAKKRITEERSITKENKLHEKQLVIDFSIAFIFWLLVTSGKGNLHKSREHSTGKNSSSELVMKESFATGLLIAIILHLAKIREVGAQSRPVPKKTAIKKKQVQVIQRTTPLLPQYGVIYAHAS